MYNLDDFTVIGELKLRLSTVTREQVDYLHTTFDPVDTDTETPVGVISEHSRALFVLSHAVLREHQMEKIAASDLVDARLMEDHRQRAVMADNLSDLLKQLVWTQARFDTGHWAEGSIGVRQGWVLVSIKEQETPSIVELLKFISKNK